MACDCLAQQLAQGKGLIYTGYYSSRVICNIRNIHGSPYITGWVRYRGPDSARAYTCPPFKCASVFSSFECQSQLQSSTIAYPGRESRYEWQTNGPRVGASYATNLRRNGHQMPTGSAHTVVNPCLRERFTATNVCFTLIRPRRGRLKGLKRDMITRKLPPKKTSKNLTKSTWIRFQGAMKLQWKACRQ